jgi:acyl carrier protein
MADATSAKLKKVTSKTLGIPLDEIKDTLQRDSDVWDSFNHLLLISELEKEMGISLSAKEVEEISTFKQLRQIVEKKSAQ